MSLALKLEIMPRKTDGIEFEIHPRPTKGEDGKLAILPFS